MQCCNEMKGLRRRNRNDRSFLSKYFRRNDHFFSTPQLRKSGEEERGERAKSGY